MSASDAFAQALDGGGRRRTAGESALAYAAHGIPVFPCAPGEKRPAVAEGFHAASTDPALVRGWWTAIPHANIGIPTGSASHLVVVDVDVHGPANGYEALDRARAAGLVDGWIAAVRTPSIGLHLYFPATSRSEQRSWQDARTGIDFRGDGGYIIAPSSARMIDGHPRHYEVLQITRERTHALDVDRLRNFLNPPHRPEPAVWSGSASQRGDVHRLTEWVSRRQEGERNHGVFWAACRMAEQNVPPSEALDALTSAGAETGLSEREVATTVRSAYRTVQVAPLRSSTHAASTMPIRPLMSAEPRALR